MEDQNCKECKEYYDPKTVARAYGKESRPFILGYCSAACYTVVNARESAKKDHPSDLIEKGKHYDKVREALKIATEYLQSKSKAYAPDAPIITEFNKILKESEVYL